MRAHLPGILSEIAESVGEANALAIAREKGGGRCHFPAVPGRKHWLSELIGYEKAKRLCKDLATGSASGDRMRGVYVTVPLGPIGSRAQMHRTIERLFREGRSHDSIARECGISRRTVQRRLEDGYANDEDGRQPDLFSSLKHS